MKAINCKQCREKIAKEAEEAYLKRQYAYLNDSAVSFAIFTTVAAIAVMHRRGRSKKYIQEFFNDLCFIYDYPELNGKRIDMISLMKQFEKDYDIDFSKIKVHLETEKDYIKSAKKEVKKHD